MSTKVEFTQEGLEKAAPHLTSQLRKLSDVDLGAIQDACVGRYRTRNRSMLVNLEYCGRDSVNTLWENDGGRKLIVRTIEQVLAERRGPVDVELWKNIGKLA